MHPVEQSGDAERRLHAALMQEPRRPVTEAQLAAIEDADARENYRIVLGFRDRLLEAATIEACYLGLFRGAIDMPPLFIDQMAHVILRNVLDRCDDPLALRAAELFFREQKATIREGHALVADLETVEMHAAGTRYGALGRLIVEAQGATAGTELDVLDRANAELYWARDSKHDTVISLTYGRAALDALCRVMQAWVAHLRGVRVVVRPLRRIEEAHWAWHIGLDAQSTAILNALWSGEQLEPGRMRRLLALFSLQFEEPAIARPEIAGRNVYLALSCDENDVVRMKPQNLLLNLPLHEA
jgi:Family of unknown function (DUF6352)